MKGWRFFAFAFAALTSILVTVHTLTIEQGCYGLLIAILILVAEIPTK